MQLRPFQSEGENLIYAAWEHGHRNVLAVYPTGSGKTVLGASIFRKHKGYSCAIAHRQELVSQISLAFARNEVYHRVIAPKPVIKFINQLHMEELGHSFYRPSARCAVAGVDTLVRRTEEARSFCNNVTLWWQDEAHHVLTANKWGTAAEMFPNARGLGVTATPDRADRKGLGRHSDGVFDTMIVGPGMRELINMGYLTDYRLFAPPSDIDLSNVTVGAAGDYGKAKLKAAVRKSHIVGDVVTHYLRLARGKLGVTFASDVETATDIANRFNLAGVPAAVVTAKTPDRERRQILRDFKNRKLLQLVNVDLFGEGFDLPAIEVVSMARPTESYALFVQQFGRSLRLMLSPVLMGAWDTYSDEQRRQLIAQSSKPHALIIDHVGNVERHGLPDAPRAWTLDRGDKRTRGRPSDVIPVRGCPECTAAYERVYPRCPYCGYAPVPVNRSGPEFVDGDLVELDAATLAHLRGEIDRVDRSVQEVQSELAAKWVPAIGQRGLLTKHVKRQEAQKALRASIAWWAGYQRAANRPDQESYRRFYHGFGIDVMSAQALNTPEALALADKINRKLW